MAARYTAFSRLARVPGEPVAAREVPVRREVRAEKRRFRVVVVAPAVERRQPVRLQRARRGHRAAALEVRPAVRVTHDVLAVVTVERARRVRGGELHGPEIVADLVLEDPGLALRREPPADHRVALAEL